MDDAVTFGALLKALRLEKNLSQLSLAKDLDVSQATISQWEIGKKMPGIAAIADVAEYFDVSVEYLLGIEARDAREFGEKFVRFVAENNFAAIDELLGLEKGTTMPLSPSDRARVNIINSLEGLDPDMRELLSICDRLGPEERKELLRFAKFRLNE